MDVKALNPLTHANLPPPIQQTPNLPPADFGGGVIYNCATMIQPNSLRLGNWVSHSGNTYKVFSLSKEWMRVVGIEKPMAFSYDNLEPIPLTPKILEKAGLKPNKYSIDGHQFDEPFYDTELEAKGWLINWDSTFGWFISPTISRYNVIPIRYLHQLQNLYWCLVGKELEINL